MRISDWSSDVCSSDLVGEGKTMREAPGRDDRYPLVRPERGDRIPQCVADRHYTAETGERRGEAVHHDRDDRDRRVLADDPLEGVADAMIYRDPIGEGDVDAGVDQGARSEEQTSELQSL